MTDRLAEDVARVLLVNLPRSDDDRAVFVADLVRHMIREGDPSVLDAVGDLLRAHPDRVGLGPTYHVVVLDDAGWTIEHTVACRLDGEMSTCEYVADFRDTEASHPEIAEKWRGRYRIDLGDDGVELTALDP